MTKDLQLGALQEFCDVGVLRRHPHQRREDSGIRHRLRLLIKRVRYAAESYPELDPLPVKAMPRLKAAQEALGNWHDCWQWLAKAEQESDLQPCVAVWRVTMVKAQASADLVLDTLSAACFKS